MGSSYRCGSVIADKHGSSHKGLGRQHRHEGRPPCYENSKGQGLCRATRQGSCTRVQSDTEQRQHILTVRTSCRHGKGGKCVEYTVRDHAHQDGLGSRDTTRTQGP